MNGPLYEKLIAGGSNAAAVLKHRERTPDGSRLDGEEDVLLSKGTLRHAVRTLRRHLARLGVRRSSRVAIVFTNQVEYVVSFLAVVGCGACALPFNPRFTYKEFWLHFEDSGARLLLVEDPVLQYQDTALRAASELGMSTACVRDVCQLAVQLYGDLGSGAEGDLDAGLVTREDTAMVLYTSGTTAKPKAVALSQGNVCASMENIVATYGLGPADRTLVVMPLFHVHGLMMTLSALAADGGLVFPRGGAFDFRTFWQDACKFRISWFTAVPSMHHMLVTRAAQDYAPLRASGLAPPLRFIRSCSAALAPDLLAKIQTAFGAPVVEAYAMTEACHQMTSNPAAPAAIRKPASVGLPHGCLQVTVLDVDDPGHHLAPYERGEVCVRGANVTAGYERNAEATAKAFSAGGWFHTGDQGYLDAEGYLFLTGRLKELINRGGEKVSPLEVDAALLACPQVSEAVSFGAPSTLFGEVVHCAVVLREGEQATEQEIIAFAKESLADYKVPVRAHFLRSMPKTATGKVLRRAVAAQVQQGERSGSEELRVMPTAPAIAPETQAPANGGPERPLTTLRVTVKVAMELERMGVRTCFGLIGVPVTALVHAIQNTETIRFVAFHNEQSASYAASIAGYLDGEVPGVLVTIGGPGLVHALAGFTNAWINCLPMLMIASSCKMGEAGSGAFQELDSLTAVRPYAKAIFQVTPTCNIGRLLHRAKALAMSGRPGPVLVDIPADTLLGVCSETMPADDGGSPMVDAAPATSGEVPRDLTQDARDRLEEAAGVLKRARRPLLVFGKGASFCRLEDLATAAVEELQVPFVCASMARGLVGGPSSHPRDGTSVRTLCLSRCDVAVLIGTRLNWLLQFGRFPPWSHGCRFILIDICRQELERRAQDPVLQRRSHCVHAHAREALPLLVRKVKGQLTMQSDWPVDIELAAHGKLDRMEPWTPTAGDSPATSEPPPYTLKYDEILHVLQYHLDRLDTYPVIVSEGANTMDFCRELIRIRRPRGYLDAGTWGTMGSAIGYAIANAVARAREWTVVVQGDSSFGFNAFEIETVVRYELPIIILVFNNGGVYGQDRRNPAELAGTALKDPSPQFIPQLAYHSIMSACGGHGYACSTLQALHNALEHSMQAEQRKPTLVNIYMDPSDGQESGSMHQTV